VTFEFDGAPVAFRPSQTLATALWAAGHRSWRTSARRQEPRGYLCGDGCCYDCVVVVNGRGNLRACQTLAAAGLEVTTQNGFGPL
jgi:aerobic-type carbon monoxide dehydrogenase small subunit (CoxS/CutS family)